ncbi:MAG: dTDP-glucose 4,6-dehydratase [Archaeoglobaceae archaeon]
MKVVVTGGLGFIGSNFIHHLLKEDFEVVNIDAMKYGSNPDNLKDVNGNYTFVEGDIADERLVANTVGDADVVVNFAAESHVDRSISSPDHFFKSNTMGVYVILEAIRKKNPDARVVQVSTDEVYGDIENGSFKESDPLRPSSPYSASKAAGDMYVLGYARTYGMNAVITRCTNNYGPFQFPEKLIPKTIIRAKQDKKIPIYGTGKNVRDWIHVQDHCEAVQTVMNKGDSGEVYNISSGEEKTNTEVVSTILELMGKDRSLIEFVEDRPGHDVRYSLDSSKVRGLGWKPRYNFKEGLRDTVDWYLENEWWWRELADEKTLHPTPWKVEW